MDIKKLVRGGLFEGPIVEKTFNWTEPESGGELFSSKFKLAADGESRFVLKLEYDLSSMGIKASIQQTIILYNIEPNNGIKKWWFLCPVTDDLGNRCGRKMGKLYLPRGETHFGCRLCHDLTYRSCQKSCRY